MLICGEKKNTHNVSIFLGRLFFPNVVAYECELGDAFVRVRFGGKNIYLRKKNRFEATLFIVP